MVVICNDYFKEGAILHYRVLGSGSKANSYIFSDGTTTIVIDNGFSKSKWQGLVLSAGYEPQKIDALFLTHMHQDHFRGVSSVSQKFRIPLYANPAIIMQGIRGYRPTAFNYDTTLSIKSLSICSFPTYHDSAGSMGFHFELGGKKVTLISDTGMTSAKMLSYGSSSHILFIEANYCPKLLESGPYPLHLKKRISSNFGHLSNIDSMEFVNQILKTDNKLETLYFCHLSDVNNSVDVVHSYIDKYLKVPKGKKLQIRVCPRGELVI